MKINKYGTFSNNWNLFWWSWHFTMQFWNLLVRLCLSKEKQPKKGIRAIKISPIG